VFGVSDCTGTPDRRGWCRECGGGHESAQEMATRRELARKTISLYDRIREGKRRQND